MNDKSGIEYEIVKQSFLAAGYDNLQHIDVHFKRGIMLIHKKSIDAITTNLSNKEYDSVETPIYASEPIINYIDCAISLKSNNYDLNSIKNFYGKKIWAFKSASLSLGEEFHKMSISNKGYTEGFAQENQAKVLINKRIDIAISDKNIFLSSLTKEGIKNGIKKFNFHSVGEPTKRAVRFYKRELRDDFNKGLNIIKKDGTYKKLLIKYKDLYSQQC
jgi:polar amino acid transport system substrate-binding protein